jgi:hypothetical protein
MKSYAAPAVNNRKYVNIIENGFRGLIETAGLVSAVSLRPRDWFPRSHWDRRIGFRGLIETAGFDSAVSLRPRDPNFANDYLDFLGENEAICKTALGRESGP